MIMKRDLSTSKNSKREWIKPDLQILDLSETQINPGKNAQVPGEPNPYGFNNYGS